MNTGNNILKSYLKNNYNKGKHYRWNSRSILSIIFDDVNYCEENFKKLESELYRGNGINIELKKNSSRYEFEKNT